MASGAHGKQTEHSGPKRGRGAYYGRKAWAKDASNRERRWVGLLLTYGFTPGDGFAEFFETQEIDRRDP